MIRMLMMIKEDDINGDDVEDGNVMSNIDDEDENDVLIMMLVDTEYLIMTD